MITILLNVRFALSALQEDEPQMPDERVSKEYGAEKKRCKVKGNCKTCNPGKIPVVRHFGFLLFRS